MILLTITFTTSPSHLFPVALEIAAQAEEFTQRAVGKISRYRAAFGRAPEQTELAIALLQHLDSIKGVLVHAGGRLLVDQSTVLATLNCFAGAHTGGGPKYYCHKTFQTQDPEAEHKHMLDINYVAPPCFSLPCARMVQLGFVPDLRLKGDGMTAYIKAQSVHVGCDWCPNFDGESWKRIS